MMGIANDGGGWVGKYITIDYNKVCVAGLLHSHQMQLQLEGMMG